VPAYPADLPHATQPVANPLPITSETLKRGQQRYNIYCVPCHSETGDGDGMVVRRGFPRPLSFHSDALRAAPDAHFYDAITNGYGVMYSYAERVDVHDRWAIAAYIRALQLSQNARLDDVPVADRTKLGAAAK
jgi:mono/diheme cytochrome c family protein